MAYKSKLDRDMKYFCEVSSKDEPLMDLRDVHLPYDVPYYHSKVLNRKLLSRQQYIDMLATPRGYQYNKHTGLMKTFRWTLDQEYCHKKKPCVKPNDDPLLITDQRYINTFLTDIWNYLTPEILEKLKDILMNELGMTEFEAEKFLVEQRIRSTFGRERVFTRTLLSERHDWVKELALMLSKKVRNYLVMMLGTERTPRVRALARVLARKLGKLTGEECEEVEEQEELNAIQACQMLLADRLAVWLDGILAKEHESFLCRKEVLKDDEEARKQEEEARKHEEASRKQDEAAVPQASEPTANS